MKKYLFFVSHSYSYSILRPIQEEIWKRGDEAAWFIEDSCPLYLKENEKHLKTIREVMEYNPIAVFAPGNHTYDFFPGIKVSVLHGFDINKRPGMENRFPYNKGFDLFCSNAVNSTKKLETLSEKYGTFKVIETGWSKFDDFFDNNGLLPLPRNPKPTVLYCSTFTKKITSTPYLYNEIEKIIQEKDWDWIITFHPLMEAETVKKYKELQDKYSNVKFVETDTNINLLKKADVMVCDSSSIIFEFMYLLKPVVTFRNTNPGDYLIDIQDPEFLEQSIEFALSRPEDLLAKIKNKIDSFHPYRDGKSSARVLEAVDYFIANYKGKLKKKPLNLFRKLKLRKKAGYFPFGPRYKAKK